MADKAVREGLAEFLVNRLATSIVDESLPLKEVERELRGTVAHIAIRQRGLKKRELASRCGVTEKSVENYLREARVNPKSPDREIARVLQDQALSLEEIYEFVGPILNLERNFTLDDAKRTIAKLLRTGEVKEEPGKRYRVSKRPAIRCPVTPDAYRGLVDQKARDMDYIILQQQRVQEEDLEAVRTKRYSRVVGDTNFVRIDFTVNVSEEDLPEFYEKLTAQIAKLTMAYEKKKGKSRVRLLLGMRRVVLLLLTCILTLLPGAGGQGDDSWELDREAGVAPEAAVAAEADDPNQARDDSWELDDKDNEALPGDPRFGAGGEENPREDLPSYFVRGDVDMDSSVDVPDALELLGYLFLGEGIRCADAADANDDGRVEFDDTIRILEHVFGVSGRDGPELGSGVIVDLTPDELGCEAGLDDV